MAHESAGQTRSTEPSSRKRTLGKLRSMLEATFAEWSKDSAARLAAALGFYTLLSLAPLVVIAVSIAGLVFEESAAQGQIAQQLGTFMGRDAA